MGRTTRAPLALAPALAPPCEARQAARAEATQASRRHTGPDVFGRSARRAAISYNPRVRSSGADEEQNARRASDEGRRPAYSMRALERDDLPAAFDLNGVRWRHARTVKHDFFAATGFYDDGDGNRAVLKVSRTADFAGVPMAWLGRWLCRRELRFYRALADLPNVPPVLGTAGPTGFIHAYVPGRPLSRDRPVPDGFFAALRDLLAELHRRGIAYVDTNKPENILL